MKKFLLVVTAVVFVLSNTAMGYAASSGTVDVLVTIEKAISIEIGGGPISMGSVGAGEIVQSSGAILIRNDGSGADETITLSVTNPGAWTFGTPGPEQYRMSFRFSADDPWALPTAVSENLAYNERKELWLQFEAPTSTEVTSQQTIRLVINAE